MARVLQHFGGQAQSQSQANAQSLGARAHYVPYGNWLADTPSASLTHRRAQADLLFRRIGITFTVYGEAGGTERLIPSDVIPRIITAETKAEMKKILTEIKTGQFAKEFVSEVRSGGKKGIASLCIGGGMGVALCVERCF